MGLTNKGGLYDLIFSECPAWMMGLYTQKNSHGTHSDIQFRNMISQRPQQMFRRIWRYEFSSSAVNLFSSWGETQQQ